MAKPLLAAHLALLVANLIYGINYSVAREVMDTHIPPFGFILLRVASAALLFWLLALCWKREPVARKDLGLLVVCGVFGVAVNQLFFFWGLSLTSPINSSIIMVTTPLLVLVIAAFWLREKIRTIRAIGIFTGLAGAVMLLLLKPGSAGVAGDLKGDMLTFFNAFSYALYLVLAKPLMKKYHPLTVMKWVFLFGLVLVIPVGWNEFAAVRWETFTPGVIYAVLFVVLGSTFLAYLLNTYGLLRLSPSVVSAYIYTQPVVSALVAMALGKDSPDLPRIMAALLIFTGVYLVSIPSPKSA